MSNTPTPTGTGTTTRSRKKAEPEPSQDKGEGLKDLVAAILGVAILVAFGVFVWYMLRNLDFDETEWARATFLFGGVEAVAFAAAGYFFGTQVQRGKVQEAKAEAKAAEKVAERADAAAASERSASSMLAEGIVAAAPSRAPQGGLLGDEAASGSAALDAVVAQAQAMLRERDRRR